MVLDPRPAAGQDVVRGEGRGGDDGGRGEGGCGGGGLVERRHDELGMVDFLWESLAGGKRNNKMCLPTFPPSPRCSMEQALELRAISGYCDAMLPMGIPSDGVARRTLRRRLLRGWPGMEGKRKTTPDDVVRTFFGRRQIRR